MQNTSVRIFVGVIVAISAGSLFLADWSVLNDLSTNAWTGLLALVILGLVSESLSLTVRVGGNSGSSSITFLPLLTCVLLFGPAPAVILHAATGTFGETIVRRTEPIKAIFNISQFLLSTVVAGLVFQLVGGAPQAGLDTPFVLQIAPLLTFGLVFLAINQGLVAVAITVSESMPLRKVWGLLVGRSGANLGYDLLISPISFVMAFLYLDYGIGGFLLVILPLLFIRTAYLRAFQLQEVSANLLKALVKAIDVRDPYTSGHSHRVSMLARRTAEAMGLPTKQAEFGETAALLHDIGKIDEIYLEILQKEGPLNVLERRVIQSHVTTGVELLESLSSYPEAVLGAVRHHHERVDGGGYPHGLVGNEIPIGARIIKVADAVDAMLSDRPYRRALPVPVVREELLEFCGTQFVRIPSDEAHLIRGKRPTHSEGKGPPIPKEEAHPFRELGHARRRRSRRWITVPSGRHLRLLCSNRTRRGNAGKEVVHAQDQGSTPTPSPGAIGSGGSPEC